MQGRNLLRDIEQRFDELRQEMLGSWGEGRALGAPRTPACDLSELEDAYELTVELPGMEKKDVQLDVDPHGARIRAQRDERRSEERKGFLRQERTSRSFERYVSFPEEVSPDGVRATFKNGVLDIHAPKLQPEKRNARRIDVA